MNHDNDRSSDSEQELFPITYALEYNFPNFHYDDPLSVSGVLKAVVENNLEKVKNLVMSSKSVNINDNHGNTPLHVAVIKNLPDILEFLLSCEDISVNIRNFYGETPLFHAVKRGYKELVNLLIKADANVNLPNLEEVTPLHLSVKNQEIAQILIENGANINAVDYSGDTPLHEAVNENSLETVCMLLYYNADANIPCSNNITPFMKSLIIENIEIQKALIEYVTDFNVATCDGMTMLGLALTHTTPFVQEIINRGAEINYKHLTLNSYSLCIDVPNTQNFCLIWNNFKYQKLFSSLNYLQRLTTLNREYFVDYLNIILNSGNIKPIEESLFYVNDLNMFVKKCHECSFPLDDLTKFLCLLCSYGYRPTDSLMDHIYRYYRFSELFYYLLFMDIINTGSFLSMSKIIYDVKLPVNAFMESIIEQLEFVEQNFNLNVDLSGCVIIFKFIIYPKLINKIKSNGFSHFQVKNSLPDVPSLLELSRNVFRDAVVETYQFNTSQYFSYLNRLNISPVYKNILAFRTPLYIINISTV